MFCTSCGHPLEAEADFCSNCGAAVTQSPELVTPSRSLGLPADALGRIGATVKQRVRGVAERSYPLQIEPKALADRLKITFHRLGYSVSVPQQSRGEPEDLEAVVTVTNEKGRGLAVRIRATKDSTLITLGGTRRAADGGGAASKTAAGAYDLPGRWLYEDYAIASKVWAVTGEYVKTFSPDAHYDEGPAPNVGTASRLDGGEPAFVGRKREVEEFERSLESTARRKPRYVAISGPPGIGKSALLREFQRIASQRRMLVVRRELDPSLATLQDISMFLMDALDRESLRSLPAQAKITNHVTRFVNDHGVTLPSFFGVGGGGISSQRVAPSANAAQEKTVLFMKRRAQKLISQGVPGAVFLLDDADHLNRIGSAWAFLKSLFDRINEDTGFFTIVVSGTNLFKRAADNLSVRRLFNILRLGPLNEDEGLLFLRGFFSSISDGFKLGDGELRKIYGLSGGHPVVLEVFATEVLDSGGLKDGMAVEGVVSHVLSRLGEGFFLDVTSETTIEERKVLEMVCSQRRAVQLRDLEPRSEVLAGIDAMSALNSLIEKGLVVVSVDGRCFPFCQLFGEYVGRENPLFLEKEKGRTSSSAATKRGEGGGKKKSLVRTP